MSSTEHTPCNPRVLAQVIQLLPLGSAKLCFPQPALRGSVFLAPYAYTFLATFFPLSQSFPTSIAFLATFSLSWSFPTMYHHLLWLSCNTVSHILGAVLNCEPQFALRGSVVYGMHKYNMYICARISHCRIITFVSHSLPSPWYSEVHRLWALPLPCRCCHLHYLTLPFISRQVFSNHSQNLVLYEA